MQDAVEEHLREIIRDHWGLTLAQLEQQTGIRRRELRKTLDRMVAGSRLRIDGGVYRA